MSTARFNCSIALVGTLVVTITAAADSGESAFLAENREAMLRMMTGMESPSVGDVDRDFVAMMVPHHQGAIDMARAELRHGRNEQLRRIAQEIIIDQQQEIAVMQLAVRPAFTPAGVTNGQ
jgi:uncharacterized protein (DUF305 family)